MALAGSHTGQRKMLFTKYCGGKIGPGTARHEGTGKGIEKGSQNGKKASCKTPSPKGKLTSVHIFL